MGAACVCSLVSLSAVWDGNSCQEEVAGSFLGFMPLVPMSTQPPHLNTPVLTASSTSHCQALSFPGSTSVSC